MAGIMHFSNYYRYMEFAEAALFRHIDWPLFDHQDTAAFGWPRVKSECRFRAPLRFGDLVRIGLAIEATTEKSIAYRFRFHKLLETSPDDKEPAEKVAIGFMTTCYAQKSGHADPITSARIPELLRRRLEPFLLPS